MKNVKTTVEFFMNKENMKDLLKGNVIDNFEEMHNNLFKDLESNNGSFYIYETRIIDPNHPDNKYGKHQLTRKTNSEYPDESDTIVARALRYIKNDKGNDCLEIELIDSLYCTKLNNPVIKVNGYYTTTDTGGLHMEKITRLTLADRN